MVADLLISSGPPSVNGLEIKTVAVEAWKTLGPHGNATTHHLTFIFGPPITSSTRAGDNGLRKPATRFPVRSFVDSATLVWNASHQLRSAPHSWGRQAYGNFICGSLPHLESLGMSVSNFFGLLCSIYY